MDFLNLETLISVVIGGLGVAGLLWAKYQPFFKLASSIIGAIRGKKDLAAIEASAVLIGRLMSTIGRKKYGLKVWEGQREDTVIEIGKSVSRGFRTGLRSDDHLR